MWKTILDRALAEDRATDDVTVRAAGIRGDAEFVLKIKQDGVFCGRGLLDCLSDFRLRVETSLADGQGIQAGTVGARIVGGAAVTLGLERSLLNLLSYVSGVATHTRLVVSHVNQKAKELGISAPRVLATRKAHAGLRDVALAGVRAGGGDVHRRDLASAVLVKDNHLKLVGGIPALDAEKMRGAFLEVASLDELEQALVFKLRGVLLDNMSPGQVREAVSVVQRRAPEWEVEVSGGLSLTNAADYVIPGVARLSIGELTHTVRALDFSLKAVGRA